jgi:hypothetical protein
MKDIKTISSLISQNYTSGYYPKWKLNFTEQFDFSDETFKHISKLVFDGIYQGEVIELLKDGEVFRTWWRIEIL